jgi:hypothetical protein
MDRERGQRLFAEASARLADLDPERCRELELVALRRVRTRGPLEAAALLRELKALPPGEPWRDRVNHTLRRIYRQMLAERVDADTARVGLNAFLDGQVETADRWLTADLLIRPWGAP